MIQLISIIGFSIDVIGKLLIAYAVIRIHSKVSQEHKIDRKVLMTIKQERMLTYAGVLLIVSGYLMQLPHKFM
jgi:hypothetical protein